MTVIGNPYAPPHGEDAALAAAYEAGLQHSEESGWDPDANPYGAGPEAEAWTRGQSEAETRNDTFDAGRTVGNGGTQGYPPNELQGPMRDLWWAGREAGWRELARTVADNPPAAGPGADLRAALAEASARIDALVADNDRLARAIQTRAGAEDLGALRETVSRQAEEIERLGRRFVIDGRVSEFTTKRNWDRIPEDAVLFYWKLV
jgi:hypothetical protein